MEIEIGKAIVFKAEALDKKTYVVSGEIVNYDKLSGVYTVKDQNGILYYRAINKIWYDIVIAQNTKDSGTFSFITIK